MAFCSKCGMQVTDGNRFCSNCGNPINAAPTNPNPAQSTPHVRPANPAANPNARPTTPFTPPPLNQYTQPNNPHKTQASAPYTPPYNAPAYTRSNSNVGNLLAMLSLGTAVLALISFFMPLLTFSFWGYSESIYGMDVLEGAFRSLSGIKINSIFEILAFLASVVNIAVAAASIKMRKLSIASIACSVVALLSILIAFADLMDSFEIGIGMILFILFRLATIALSGVSLAMAKN